MAGDLSYSTDAARETDDRPYDAFRAFEDSYYRLCRVAAAEVEKVLRQIDAVLSINPNESLENCSIRVSLEGIQLVDRPFFEWVNDKSIYRFGTGIAVDFKKTDTLAWLREVIDACRDDLADSIVGHAYLQNSFTLDVKPHLVDILTSGPPFARHELADTKVDIPF